MSNTKIFQQKFQNGFNTIMKKKNITKKGDILEQANKFFKFCLKNVKNSKHCPFPEYLMEEYLKSKKKKINP